MYTGKGPEPVYGPMLICCQTVIIMKKKRFQWQEWSYTEDHCFLCDRTGKPASALTNGYDSCGGDETVFGAIAGDVVGSVFEWHNVKTTEFPLFSRFTRFTDDTVLTAAVADALLRREKRSNRFGDASKAKAGYRESLRRFAAWYPDAGYGQMFEEWTRSASSRPYRSYGNGAAMRVSPVGYACSTLEDVLREAKWSAQITHNHRQGIRGALAIAACVFLARRQTSKDEIKSYVTGNFGYDLGRTLDE
ncbi:MAG: ADP-ribosylglycohydrolase family protein, partial [Paenibacillaceae bacterium]|nr:ADP-ribosylglycohydrolase family protein [Paenibacillaceae bacterium]